MFLILPFLLLRASQAYCICICTCDYPEPNWLGNFGDRCDAAPTSADSNTAISLSTIDIIIILR